VPCGWVFAENVPYGWVFAQDVPSGWVFAEVTEGSGRLNGQTVRDCLTMRRKAWHSLDCVDHMVI